MLATIVDRVSRSCALLAAWLFVATGAMLGYEVAARYLFNAPTIWAAELSQLCLIWASFLAASWLLRTRSHININLVTALLPPRARWVLEIASLLAVAAFAAWIGWHGYWIFADSLHTGRSTGTMMNLPNWITEASLPFGFGLLALQALVECARLIATGEATPPDASGFMRRAD